MQKQSMHRLSYPTIEGVPAKFTFASFEDAAEFDRRMRAVGASASDWCEYECMDPATADVEGIAKSLQEFPDA